MKVEFLPAAERELIEAAEHYQEQVFGLGSEFVAEVHRVAQLLVEHQALGPKLDSRHRRLALRRFPYALIYRVDSDVVRIVAVAHRRRRPSYWRRRTP